MYHVVADVIKSDIYNSRTREPEGKLVRKHRVVNSVASTRRSSLWGPTLVRFQVKKAPACDIGRCSRPCTVSFQIRRYHVEVTQRTGAQLLVGRLKLEGAAIPSTQPFLATVVSNPRDLSSSIRNFLQTQEDHQVRVCTQRCAMKSLQIHARSLKRFGQAKPKLKTPPQPIGHTISPCYPRWRTQNFEGCTNFPRLEISAPASGTTLVQKFGANRSRQTKTQNPFRASELDHEQASIVPGALSEYLPIPDPYHVSRADTFQEYVGGQPPQTFLPSRF
ncbi:unnamed protein product [Allacma fusca]|uniref:Uncharacterized protein n=1 Tax=Allacma fusca TaxID=39272 RepID=A0A8J2J0X8_9HEXA|nr:unnamed protein product [Allacma fusca]